MNAQSSSTLLYCDRDVQQSLALKLWRHSQKPHILLSSLDFSSSAFDKLLLICQDRKQIPFPPECLLS